jgi:hypothetical protein
MATRIEQAKIENIGLKKRKGARDWTIPAPFFLDLLRGVSEEGKKSHFSSTRRLFEGV